MGMKIANMATGRVQAPRYVYPGEGVAGMSADSYDGVQLAEFHWMSCLPLVGKALPFLSLTACGFGSSCNTEAKVGVGVVFVAGVASLFHLLNRSINNRRIAELPSPLQIMKYGISRVRFPNKLDKAEKVITYYMNRGFSEEAARRVAYAWFFHKGTHSKGIGDLNQLDLHRGDIHGISSSFPMLGDYPFDNRLPDAMERVGCSAAMGLMLNALDRGIRTSPELVNVFLALNLKGYHASVGSPAHVANTLRYILSKFSSRSAAEYEVGEGDVARLFEASSVMHRSDKKITDGIAHLLFGGMALGAFEAGQFDGGLELGFAHIWSARRFFESSPALQNPSSRERKSIGTVTNGYPYVLSGRALDLWKTSFPGRLHPKNPWSTSMLPATTKMLQSFEVNPV